MTEAQWLCCADPEPMLCVLGGKANERKLRLFAVACCRRIPEVTTYHLARETLEVAERYADGLATQAELQQAAEAAREAAKVVRGARRIAVLAAAAICPIPELRCPFVECIHLVCKRAGNGASRAERATLAGLLRDVLGNHPFHPVIVSPHYLTWNEGIIPKLARGIYEDRAFDRLPILADALEEAGCTGRRLLDHCRSSGPHVAGCWVVDLLRCER
jgi:hypothetical protein